MKEKFEELIGSFADTRIGISDGFLTRELAQLLQENLLNLNRGNKMKSAGIGNQQLKDANQNKRGDKIYWIDNETKDGPERAFLNQIDEFIVYLNESCYTGINAYEFHYALYETGSSYTRHKDQFRDDSNRKFSLINYLNTDWLNEDGGELWIHQQDKSEKIMPRIQKAVFFQSDVCEHEVCTSLRPRMSITGWLKRC
jgi:SM-20-related protein